QKICDYRARKAIGRTGQRRKRTGQRRRRNTLVISLFLTFLFGADGSLRRGCPARAVCAAAASAASARRHLTTARTMPNSSDRVSQLVNDALLLFAALFLRVGLGFGGRFGRMPILLRIRMNSPSVLVLFNFNRSLRDRIFFDRRLLNLRTRAVFSRR